MHDQSEQSVHSFRQLVPTWGSVCGHPNRTKRVLRTATLLVAIAMTVLASGVTFLLSKMPSYACTKSDVPSEVAAFQTAFLQFAANETAFTNCGKNWTSAATRHAAVTDYEDGTHENSPTTLYMIGSTAAIALFFFARVYGIRGTGHGHAVACCGPCFTFLIDTIIPLSCTFMLTFVTKLQTDGVNGERIEILLTATQQMFALFLLGSLVYSLLFLFYVKCVFCCFPCCRGCNLAKWMLHSFVWLLLLAGLFGTYVMMHHYLFLAQHYLPHIDPSATADYGGANPDHGGPPTALDLEKLLLSLFKSLCAWNPLKAASRHGHIALFLQLLAYAGAANAVLSFTSTVLDLPYIGAKLRQCIGIDTDWADKKEASSNERLLTHPMLTAN